MPDDTVEEVGAVEEVGERTPEQWREAFAALTGLYNGAIKRALDAEDRLEKSRGDGRKAIAALMDYYDASVNGRVALAEKRAADALAERDQLRAVIAAMSA